MIKLILLSLILFLLIGIGVTLVLILRRIKALDVDTRSAYTIASVTNNRLVGFRNELRETLKLNGFDWAHQEPDLHAMAGARQLDGFSHLGNQDNAVRQISKHPKLNELLRRKEHPENQEEAKGLADESTPANE